MSNHHTAGLPKIELHVHLEGCLSMPTLRRIAQRNGVALPVHLQQATDKIYFDTFDAFVQTFHAIGHSLATEADFVELIRDYIAYTQQNNILYSEVSWTPFLYMQKGLRFGHLMGLFNNEIAKAGAEGKIHFIIDTQRDHGLEVAQKVFAEVLAHRDMHIVGVGLTGYEQGFDPAVFQQPFALAREQGLGVTAHAGEYGTAWDIWQCIRHLGAQRIGHGIRAIEDKELMAYSAEQGIHYEICPTSNILLKRVADAADHPLPQFVAAGMNVGINSDDPAIFATSLSDEWANVMQWYQYTAQDMQGFAENAYNAAFGDIIS